MPGFAADAASADPEVAAGARESFVLAHRVLGNLIGETFGYLLTAAWTLLVVVALGRSIAGRWFTALGAVSAVLVLSGVLSPLDLPVIDQANFIGYVLWSVWRWSSGSCSSAGRVRPPLAPFRRGPPPKGDDRDELLNISPLRSHHVLADLDRRLHLLSRSPASSAGVVAGPVSSPSAALVAGLITGAVIGDRAVAGQPKASPGPRAGSRPARSAWAWACCSGQRPSGSAPLSPTWP